MDQVWKELSNLDPRDPGGFSKHLALNDFKGWADHPKQESLSKSSALSLWHSKLKSHSFLAAHNWPKKKKKSVFLTCFSYKNSRVESVSLKYSNNTLKIMIFPNMSNWGQFLEEKNRYFVNNFFI